MTTCRPASVLLLIHGIGDLLFMFFGVETEHPIVTETAVSNSL